MVSFLNIHSPATRDTAAGKSKQENLWVVRYYSIPQNVTINLLSWDPP